MRAGMTGVLFAGAIASAASPAPAYTIGSGVTTSCHEVLTFEALVELGSTFDARGVRLPASDEWRRVAESVAAALRATNPEAPGPGDLTDEQKFGMWSVIVGVRAPDTDGHSVTDMATLRLLQSDPTPDGQYLHALRGLADDGIQGDIAAVEGSKRIIREVLEQARAVSPPSKIIEVPFYLDFYGNMEVEVLEIPYRLGRAVHTLQDAYAHMLRSDDGRIIYHVGNYLEAIGGTLVENRDGMAHSNSLDDCTRPIDTLTDGASRATRGFAVAARAYIAGDDTLIEKGLSPCDSGDTDPQSCGWITYNPECAAAVAAEDSAAQGERCCTQSNNYCDSKWLPVFREEQAGPYLKEIFSCSFATRRSRSSIGLLAAALALLGLGFRRRRAGVGAAVPGAVLLLAPALGRAAPPDSGGESLAQTASQAGRKRLEKPIFVGVEGHLSLFSDAPETSLINTTLGFAVRGGYRFERWGLLGHIERNYWLPTEFSSSLEKGALNIGIGAEYLYLDGFARSSILIGPSVLMFDTALHDKGHTGLYVDLRPIGVRYHPHENVAIAFDPLSVAYVQPIVGDENVIRQVEYRTLLGVEAVF